MSVTTKKKRKLRKPRWTHISPLGDCLARCSGAYGLATVRIKGFPIKPAKVKQLAKWFADAAAWLEEQEGE